MPTSKSSIDNRDVYYRLGKSAGYRARSAYKLLHLDEEFNLFDGVQTAVDLCAAPGSWSQVLGQKLHPTKDEGGRRVVSLDLQPMAPLPNITTLQTDITIPSTIPLVLDALGGRKADLVVCDGAPDVTGVHDLDAYLHSQLLLAAITLSLTLLAPHSTLIFKIFLSPLDPQAALLASQLRCFFPGPTPPSELTSSFEEFDISDDAKDEAEGATGTSRGSSAEAGKEGYDLEGRRGGVWVRKPRSSRKGSGEAFIVCRNFNSSRVPLPSAFSPSALAELRKQTSGTLTLDSLASLGVGEIKTSKEWEMIKGYVGGGDLNPVAAFPTPAKSRPPTAGIPIQLQLPEFSPAHEHVSTSPKALFAQPTPLDGPSEYFHPKPDNSSGSPTSPTKSKASESNTFLSPERLHIDTHKGASSSSAKRAAVLAGHPDLGGSSSRQSSLDSLTPNPSPISLIDPTRPWAPSAHFPPTTVSRSHAQSAGASASLDIPPANRFRSISNASASSATSIFGHREEDVASTTPLVSPALSSASRTSLFFGGSQKDSLPLPPRALPNSNSLGRGLPSGVPKPDDRSTSMPFCRPDHARDAADRTSAWAGSRFGESIDLTSPATSSQGYSISGLPERRAKDYRLGFEDQTTSRLRALSNPVPSFPHSPGTPGPSNHSPATSQFLKSSTINEPLATLPSSPNVHVDVFSSPASTSRPSILKHGRRESQQLEREHREAKEGAEIRSGDLIHPEQENHGAQTTKRGWKVVRKLGEGAFSSVWSAIPQMTSESVEGGSSTSRKRSRVAALKLMDRQLSLRDSRTRISFLREVEVLRHISHPSIVSYLDSFTTPTHHVLVLEELSGGELFDLMSDDDNRRRMILPSPRPDGVSNLSLIPGERPKSEQGNDEGAWDKVGEGFVRRIFCELTRAVGWLHEVGVVHRDIKLENILFTVNPFAIPPTSTQSIPLDLLPNPGPLIKLTDFGLSRFISLSAPLLQTRCGSESFAAPEIIMGKPYDGRETDAWAMGVVLYGLIVGELPFDREEENYYSGSSENTSAAPSGSATPSSARPFTPSLLLDSRTRGRKRMMKIARGEYSFPPNVGSENVRKLIAGLLVRDPKKRLKVADIWDQEFMSGPGGISRPVLSATASAPTSASSSVNGDAGIGPGEEVRRRRVLDGFLVEEDEIEEVARAEL